MTTLNQIPTYITSDDATAAPSYTVTAMVYSNKTFQTKAVDVLVKVPSTLVLQRLVRNSLGADWVLMTWNTTCNTF